MILISRMSLLVWLLLLVACGGGGGGGGGTCTEGQACTPTTACHAGRISCASGAPVCVDSGNVPDGTSCASGGACQTGVCKRAVSGTFQTTFWTDDGAKVTVNSLPTPTFGIGGVPATPSALLVADSSSTGYANFALNVDANQGFSVPGVPSGPYFIELDKTTFFPAACVTTPIEVVVPQLFELTSSTPDLQLISSGRRDLALAASTLPQVTLDISNMDPWASGDTIDIASSQALAHQRGFFLTPPMASVTSFAGPTAWISEGLPDGSKGDVVFVYQRATIPVGTGTSAAKFHRATKFAKLTDFTVVGVPTPSATVPLVDAPQTGSVGADMRHSQFVALASDVNPAATFRTFSLAILAVPHSVDYPEMPAKTLTGLAALDSTQASTDVNYGALAYGQFLDPLWKEFRRAFYMFDVTSVGESAVIQTDVPVAGLTAGPIAPVVGPPKSPRVNGNDAFVGNPGVGLQPTISWSPPAIGSPTSYVVDVLATALPCDAAGKIAGLTAVIHSGTSFKIPPGILRSGIAYRVIITARQAPWDTADAGPFRTGTPLHSAQCVTAPFSP